MSALKIVAIAFAQVVLGPCAGPVGLFAMVAFTIAAFMTFRLPISVVFLALVAGHSAGSVLCGAYVYFKRRRKVELK
jgi:hypothetical protein